MEKKLWLFDSINGINAGQEKDFFERELNIWLYKNSNSIKEYPNKITDELNKKIFGYDSLEEHRCKRVEMLKKHNASEESIKWHEHIDMKYYVGTEACIVSGKDKDGYPLTKEQFIELQLLKYKPILSKAGKYKANADLSRKLKAYIDFLEQEQELAKIQSKELQAKDQEQPPQIPRELNTTKAKELLNIAVKGGYLNKDFSLNTEVISVAQAALLAEIIAEKIGLKYRWKPFETLWNKEHLAQTRNNSINKIGTVRGGEAIEALYN